MILHIFPMSLGAALQFAPVKKIGGIDRDVDAFFGEQQFSNLPPRLPSLAQLADEIEVRSQDALEWFAAAFSLCRFDHHWTG